MSTEQLSTDDSDHALIQGCLRGSTQSFRVLYRRHQARVRSTLMSLCDPEVLDDLVQDVFVRVWKGLPKMEGRAKFTTWLYRITWNVAADYRRSAAQKRTRWQSLTHQLPSQSTAPNWQHLHYQDVIKRGMTQLSFEHRSVMVLHDLQDLPQQEIAEMFEIPVGTVKSRLHHARAALRKFLQHEGISL